MTLLSRKYKEASRFCWYILLAQMRLGEVLDKLPGANCQVSRPKERHFVQKSFYNLSPNYTIGPIKDTNQLLLALLLSYNTHACVLMAWRRPEPHCLQVTKGTFQNVASLVLATQPPC